MLRSKQERRIAKGVAAQVRVKRGLQRASTRVFRPPMSATFNRPVASPTRLATNVAIPRSPAATPRRSHGTRAAATAASSKACHRRSLPSAPVFTVATLRPPAPSSSTTTLRGTPSSNAVTAPSMDDVTSVPAGGGGRTSVRRVATDIARAAAMVLVLKKTYGLRYSSTQIPEVRARQPGHIEFGTGDWSLP